MKYLKQRKDKNMKKKWAFFLLVFLGSSPLLWAHKGHGAVTHPVVVKWGLRGVQEITNIHPLFVHFPVALLLAAAGFYFLGALLRKDELFAAGKWTLFAGALSTIPAVWTGWVAANTVAHDEEVHQIMMKHQTLGFVLLGLSAILSLWLLIMRANIPAKGRIFFMIALLLMSGLIMQQADFGGRLVFLKGVGVKPVSSMVTEMATKHTGSDAVDMKNKNMLMEQDQRRFSKLGATSEIWKKIQENENHLGRLIHTGQLDQVHETAFAIRDLSRAFAQNLTGLSVIKSDRVKAAVDEISRVADFLDEYGDAGDEVKTEDQFHRLKDLLNQIQAELPVDTLSGTNDGAADPQEHVQHG
jgi:uncharacterized membrane protein